MLDPARIGRVAHVGTLEGAVSIGSRPWKPQGLDGRIAIRKVGWIAAILIGVGGAGGGIGLAHRDVAAEDKGPTKPAPPSVGDQIRALIAEWGRFEAANDIAQGLTFTEGASDGIFRLREANSSRCSRKMLGLVESLPMIRPPSTRSSGMSVITGSRTRRGRSRTNSADRSRSSSATMPTSRAWPGASRLPGMECRPGSTTGSCRGWSRRRGGARRRDSPCWRWPGISRISRGPSSGSSGKTGRSIST